MSSAFRELALSLIKFQKDAGYKRGWVWYRLLDEFDGEWTQLDLGWLSTQLGYKPGWARFKWSELVNGGYRVASPEGRYEPPPPPPPKEKSPSRYQQKLASALGMAGIEVTCWPLPAADFARKRRAASLRYHPDTGGSHEGFLAFTKAMEFLQTDLELSHAG